MIRLHLKDIYIYQDFIEKYMNNTDIERKDQLAVIYQQKKKPEGMFHSYMLNQREKNERLLVD